MHHDRWYEVQLTQDRLRIAVDNAERADVRVHVQGRPYVLAPGEALELEASYPSFANVVVWSGAARRR